MALRPEDSTAAARQAFGSHPGHRALHARGTLLKGTFTGTPEAARLTRAAHMQGEAVPVTARLSNGAGNPNVPDYKPDVRGLAVKFYLPDGSRTDVVSQTAPRFPVSTPEAFIELMRAQHPSPAMAWRLPKFLATHPRALSTIPSSLPTLRPLDSYATTRFYALHAFRWVDAEGGSRWVRYVWQPELGDTRISPREAKRRGRDYLQDDIRHRAASGPVRRPLALG